MEILTMAGVSDYAHPCRQAYSPAPVDPVAHSRPVSRALVFHASTRQLESGSIAMNLVRVNT